MLPIVTRGPTENIEALLYLKGVDVAIISADALAQFEAGRFPTLNSVSPIFIDLFPSELHIFVRPEITSLDDLRARKSTSTQSALLPPIPAR